MKCEEILSEYEAWHLMSALIWRLYFAARIIYISIENDTGSAILYNYLALAAHKIW